MAPARSSLHDAFVTWLYSSCCLSRSILQSSNIEVQKPTKNNYQYHGPIVPTVNIMATRGKPCFLHFLFFFLALFFFRCAASWSCDWQRFLFVASVRFSLFALLVNASCFLSFFVALIAFCCFALLVFCFLDFCFLLLFPF